MAEFKPIKDISRERICELADNAASLFRDGVRPIYASTLRGSPEHIGSCIALKQGDTPYLLTAAHVIDWNDVSSLYIGDGELHQLSMDFYATIKPDGDRDADHFDFAIGKLPDSDVAALAGTKFINGENIERNIGYVPGQTYTSIGYPNSKNKKIDNQNRIAPATLFHHTGVAKQDSDLVQKLGVSGMEHILISQNAKYSLDATGRKVSSVNLRGMSGGAVIGLGNLADPNVLAGRVNPTPLLAGVFIEFHRDHSAIVATRLDAILKAKGLMFP
ncbi:MAG: hypothetical protein R8L07_10990 [Alphaproteobacteria bacterium]|nr:hypothetical protein [Alphaproteobacteria bacterium]